MSEESNIARKTTVFISYSRKNKEFAHNLNQALRSSGIDAWVDWEGIPLSSDWMAEITAAIESADAFLFVISPDSLTSKVCAEELELGLKHNKKIIPVLRIEPEKEQTMHSKLSSTNWVYLREQDDFDSTLPKLIETIQTDLGWVRRHTRLLQRSLEWDGRKRNNSYLLQGTDLEEGEQWATEANPDSGRSVVPLQAEYLHESRKAAVRLQRNLTISVAIALVVSLLIGAYAFVQRGIAIENEKIAKQNEALALEKEQQRAQQQTIAEEHARRAEENARIAEENAVRAQAQRNASEARIYQTKTGELDTSTLLAVDAYRKIPGLLEAEDVLRANLSVLPLPLKQMYVGSSITKIQASPDRKKFVTSDQSGQACVWSTDDGTRFFCVQQEGALYDSVFSRDGKYLATGSSAGLVNLWNAETGELVESFQLNGSVWDLQAHPNGTLLGVGTNYGFALIDMQNLKILVSNNMSSDVYKLDFGADGRFLAMAFSSGTISVWELANSRTHQGPTHSSEALDISFSPDGKWVVSAGADSTARVMRIGDSRQKYSVVHGDWVEYTAFGPSSDWFVTVSDDGFVRVIDTLTGQENLRMAHDSYVTKARISSDGQWVASTGYDHTARIWDSKTGAEVVQVTVAGIGSAIEFNPTATRLIVGDSLGNITLWDISHLKNRAGAAYFPEALHKVHFSADGQWLIVNSDDKKTWRIPAQKINTANNEREAFIFTKGLTEDMVVSPDSEWVAVVESDANIADYNRVILASLTSTRKAVLAHDLNLIMAVAFTPDSKRLISADEKGQIHIWDVSSGEKVASFNVGGVVLSLAVSPDGKYLVAGLEQGAFNPVWNLTSLEQVSTLEQVGATHVLQFSPDGKWLVAGGSASYLNIWQAEDGAFSRVAQFQTTGTIRAAHFNPEGNLFAMGDSKGFVYLIDLGNMEEVARLPHANNISGISFSTDGTQLAVASRKSIHLWDVPSIQFIYDKDLIDTACSRLIQNFSFSKWEIIFGEDEYQATCPNLRAGSK